MKLRVVGPNQTEIDLGKVVLFFSYKTCVVVLLKGVGWYRTNKKYSNTTSGHISKYLGGIDAQKVPQEWIDQLLDKVEIKAP